MQVEREIFQDTDIHASLLHVKAPLVDRERMLAEVELHYPTADQPNRSNLKDEPGSVEDRLHVIEDKIRGNIDALDYLRGISGLEKPFTTLVENVLRAALVLSQDNNVSYPQFVFDPLMDEKVDECWTYITQLTDVVRWHVTHAVRYHKFHHNLKTAQLELSRLIQTSKTHLEHLAHSQSRDSERLIDLDRTMNEQLEKLNQLTENARQLQIQSRTLPALYRRRLRSPTRHSAHMLASIRLPSGKWVHRGDAVRVWTNNTVAAELHHEWQVETQDGSERATLPSLCMWLDSPETSPTGSIRVSAKECAHEDYVTRSLTLFANNKGLAQRFQTELFDAWSKLNEDVGRMLLPTYRDYIQELLRFENELPVTKIEKLRSLIKNMERLAEFGDAVDAELLTKLQSKLRYLTEHYRPADERRMDQLANTLTTWNTMLDQLGEAKQSTSLRSLSEEASKKISPRRFHSFDARRVVTSPMAIESPIQETRNIRNPTVDASAIEELVTSFADPCPQTFQVHRDNQTEAQNKEDAVTIEKSISSLHADDPKMDQPRPQPVTVDTRDSMAQITTPYFPTLVHCPKCSAPYEVDIYDNALELFQPELETNIGAIVRPASQSLSSLSLIGRNQTTTPLAERAGIQPTVSPPVLAQVGDSMRLGMKERKKLFRLPRRRDRHRSHSLNASTADSSGFGSSPDPALVEMSEVTTEPEHMKKKREKHSRMPLFHWGKRSKSKRHPMIESKNANDGQMHAEPDLSGDYYPPKDRTCLSQPILRSRSWVQQGTPWGYGPPLHHHWHPVGDLLSPRVEKVGYAVRGQSHSERILSRASRPRVVSEQLSFQHINGSEKAFNSATEYNTLDSGIQTDTDMAAGVSHSASMDQSPHVTWNKVPYHHENVGNATIQCNILAEGVTQLSHLSSTGVDRITRPLASTSLQTVEHDRILDKNTNTWDVSCQVGVIQSDHCVSADLRDVVTMSPKLGSENSVEIQIEPENLVQSHGDLQHTGLSDTGDPYLTERYSVACQIGCISKDTGVGHDVLEAVQLLDESISVFEKKSDAGEPETKKKPNTFGKKLQVGDPWWKHRAFERVPIPMIDASVQLIRQHFLKDEFSFKDQCTQTVGESEALTSTRNHTPVCQLGQVDRIGGSESMDKFIRTNSLVIPSEMAYHLKIKPKMASVSTLVGHVSTAMEQQTDISMSDTSLISKEKMDAGTDALPAVTQSSIGTYTRAPQQSSTATQIGTCSEMDQLVVEPPISPPSVVPQLSSSKLTEIDSTPVKLESVELHNQLVPKPTQCSRCGQDLFAVKSSKSPRQSRSKRIQKGPPCIDSTISTSDTSSSVEVVEDTNRKPHTKLFVNTTNVNREPRQRHVSSLQGNRLVIDIGLYRNEHEKVARTMRHHRGRSQPDYVRTHHFERQEVESTDSTSITDRNPSSPIDSMRVCWQLKALSPSGQRRCKLVRKDQQESCTSENPRSLSVDDINVMSPGAASRLQ